MVALRDIGAKVIDILKLQLTVGNGTGWKIQV